MTAQRDHAMNPVQFFKCLADETRLRTLMLIEREAELCVCELTAALGQSQPKISRHLAQLRQCELLLDRRQGQWVFYRLNPSLPDWARDVIDGASRANGDFLADSLHNLCRMGERPERARACC